MQSAFYYIMERIVSIEVLIFCHLRNIYKIMSKRDSDSTTHFGFQTVAAHEKEHKVGAVFHAVAQKYDLMNDVLSFGIHRWWKRFTIELSGVRPGNAVLDLAGGSGDLTRLLINKVGATGLVVLADLNASMLEVGRDRLLDDGISNTVTY